METKELEKSEVQYVYILKAFFFFNRHPPMDVCGKKVNYLKA